MNPTYGPEADAYRDKVQAFLAEKLPSDWRGIGQLPNDEVSDFVDVVAHRAVRGRATSRRAGRSSTAAPGCRRSSR